MASNINPFNIDGTYPVAGQDNDSQGFRDNFTNIRNNLSYAKSELEDLQSKAVLKSALNGSTLSNDFGGSPIVNAQFRAVSDTIVDLGILSGTVNLDFSQANFHKVQTSGSIVLAFGNGTTNTWPAAGRYGRLTFWVTISDPTHTVQLPLGSPGVSKGYADIASIDQSSGVITFDTAGDYVFEFSTQDNGTNVLVQDLTRNRATFRDPSFYLNNTVVPTLLVGYGPAVQSALAFEIGEDLVSVAGSVNSVTAGNLANATPGSQMVSSTQFIGGYSMTGMRGNLITDGVPTPVQSKDPVGFITGVAYTGTGSVANTFSYISTIGMYATGSNVTYGLGGNIALFTAPDGKSPKVVQAVGIENDQSTKFFGNVIMTPKTPTGPTAIGTAGQFAVDSNYIYVCVATNTWKRVAISSAGW